MSKITVPNTWLTLNNALLKLGEEDCKRLLQAEIRGRFRLAFALRIHSRLNKLRAARERSELLEKYNSVKR